MVGYARLQRGKITCDTIQSVSAKSWTRFVDSLKLDERMEFNEGDIGLAGGIQVTEPSNANPTTVDSIKRFGGSTSPAMQWPEEEGVGDDGENKFERLEKLIVRGMKNMGGSSGKKKGGTGSSGGGGSNSNKSGSDAGAEDDAGSE